jgi:hypothetical protein
MAQANHLVQNDSAIGAKIMRTSIIARHVSMLLCAAQTSASNSQKLPELVEYEIRASAFSVRSTKAIEVSLEDHVVKHKREAEIAIRKGLNKLDLNHASKAGKHDVRSISIRVQEVKESAKKLSVVAAVKSGERSGYRVKLVWDGRKINRTIIGRF